MLSADEDPPEDPGAEDPEADPESEASGEVRAQHPGILVDDPEAEQKPSVQQALPDRAFVFPLQRAVPFPKLMMPVLLDSSRAREIFAKAEEFNGHVLLVTQRDPEADVEGTDDLYPVGVLSQVLKVLRQPDGSSVAMCQGLRRALVGKVVRKKPYLLVHARELVELPSSSERSEALFQALQQTLREMGDVSEQHGDDFATTVLNIDDGPTLADFVGAHGIQDIGQKMALLEAADVEQRLEKALEFVTFELKRAQLGARIKDEIRERTEQAQKDYFLKEQLKIIRRELGEESDPRSAEIERLEKALAEAGLPEAAQARADEEMQRLRTTPVESGEYGVIRNYLDWIVALPWSRTTEDNHDLADAARILDEDHYGLDEVKDRILEFLAVRKLKPDQGGSILCFSGPPGVGKTSLGRSIARAMGREFWRFSLGGMRDEAEIKGHRRTYIGAMPGRIMQGLKACGARNPVILLDELDKLGSDFRGDPSSALLEVLDPEQNHSFSDHYVDVPFDLSRVMFLATANVLSQIPEPLRDRMEIIEIPGYLLEEKIEIARRHLLPKQLEAHGLKKAHLGLAATTFKKLIPLYTREAGVRGLEKVVARLCRKSALAVARGRKAPGRVSIDDVQKLLGRARFQGEGARRVRGPGVVQGLAWTPVGGDVLFLEAVSSQGKGAVQLTGSLGDVMSESARVAMSFLRSRAEEFDLDLETMQKADVHLHFPAGSIPKDGPSAGIAIACSFLSLFRGRACPADLAMTGELTVVGEVLPVGGIREKVLAAKNLGIRRLILPAENRAEVEELKPELVQGLEFFYVEEFREVYEVVFPARGKKPKGIVVRARKRPPSKKGPTRKASTKKARATRRRASNR